MVRVEWEKCGVPDIKPGGEVAIKTQPGGSGVLCRRLFLSWTILIDYAYTHSGG